MIRHLREIQARRTGEETRLESGFTLIELLIVIVVIGILAATVIFALGGVSGQSAQAACNSDAKSYETAVAAYESNNPGTTTVTTANLLTTGTDGKYLHAAANNTNYVVAVGGDYTGGAMASDVFVNGKTGTSISSPTGDAVYVGLPGQALVAYDGELAGQGCNAA